MLVTVMLSHIYLIEMDCERDTFLARSGYVKGRGYANTIQDPRKPARWGFYLPFSRGTGFDNGGFRHSDTIFSNLTVRSRRS